MQRDRQAFFGLGTLSAVAAVVTAVSGGDASAAPPQTAPAVMALPAADDVRLRDRFMNWQGPALLEGRRVDVAQPVDRLSISSHFGFRADPFRTTHAMHRGIDVPGRFGAPVYASADGVVERAGYSGGYGNMIDIRHSSGLVTRYGHLSSILVDASGTVRSGQIIGRVGSTGRSTGNHLHFEVRMDGQAVDPLPFLSSSVWVDGGPPPDDGKPRVSAFARMRMPTMLGPDRLPGPEAVSSGAASSSATPGGD